MSQLEKWPVVPRILRNDRVKLKRAAEHCDCFLASNLVHNRVLTAHKGKPRFPLWPAAQLPIQALEK